MNASPPTQVEAAATWNTSRKIASAPLVRACPAAEIVGIRRSAKSGRSSSFRDRLAIIASAPTTIATPICHRNAWPNRVWRTE